MLEAGIYGTALASFCTNASVNIFPFPVPTKIGVRASKTNTPK